MEKVVSLLVWTFKCLYYKRDNIILKVSVVMWHKLCLSYNHHDHSMRRNNLRNKICTIWFVHFKNWKIYPFIHGSINRNFYAFKAVIFWGQIFATLWNCFIGEKLCFRVQCAYSANTNDIQFSSFSNPHYGLLLQFCSLKHFAWPPAPSLYVPLYVGRQLSKVVYLLSLDLPLNRNLCVAYRFPELFSFFHNFFKPDFDRVSSFLQQQLMK